MPVMTRNSSSSPVAMRASVRGVGLDRFEDIEDEARRDEQQQDDSTGTEQECAAPERPGLVICALRDTAQHEANRKRRARPAAPFEQCAERAQREENTQ